MLIPNKPVETARNITTQSDCLDTARNLTDNRKSPSAVANCSFFSHTTAIPLLQHKLQDEFGTDDDESEYLANFTGGGVVYSNDLKMKLLGVNKETLSQYGAVSEQTVIEMAKGALQNFNSDYSVAVSGIAGPDGGSAEKPVGTIWIAVATKDKTFTQKLQLGGFREQNIHLTSINILNLLRKVLK